MFLQPVAFAGQRVGTPLKRTHSRSVNRRKIRPPLALGVGLDVAGANNVGQPQDMKVDGLGIDTSDLTVWVDE